jgi:hypothetical protein
MAGSRSIRGRQSYPCCCCSSGGQLAVLMPALPLLGPPTGKPLRSNAWEPWTFPPTAPSCEWCARSGGPGQPRFSPHERPWPLSLCPHGACLAGRERSRRRSRVCCLVYRGEKERPGGAFHFQQPLRSLTVNSRLVQGCTAGMSLGDPDFARRHLINRREKTTTTATASKKITVETAVHEKPRPRKPVSKPRVLPRLTRTATANRLTTTRHGQAPPDASSRQPSASSLTQPSGQSGDGRPVQLAHPWGR